AADNGYSNDGTRSVVQVNIPPQSGTYQGKAGYVEVLVTSNSARTFSSLFGSGTIAVSARAVAQGTWLSTSPGIIVLDNSGRGALQAGGNGTLTVNASIIVDSSDSSALVANGQGIVKATELDVSGGYTVTNNAQLLTSPVPNNINTGAHPVPDPLAY